MLCIYECVLAPVTGPRTFYVVYDNVVMYIVADDVYLCASVCVCMCIENSLMDRVIKTLKKYNAFLKKEKIPVQIKRLFSSDVYYII